jgi:ATP-binding cassette subfamily E protein 1
LQAKCPSLQAPFFQANVVKVLDIDTLLDQSVSTLSGGELQRIAIILCLGQPAQVYLLDEPSA